MSVGTLVLAWWLIAAASGPEAYATFSQSAASGSGRSCCSASRGRSPIICSTASAIWPGTWATASTCRPPKLTGWLVIILSVLLAIGVFALRLYRVSGVQRMSMETPLHRVQGLGSAHSGVKHFWRQRVTAAALVPLVDLVRLVGRSAWSAAAKPRC